LTTVTYQRGVNTAPLKWTAGFLMCLLLASVVGYWSIQDGKIRLLIALGFGALLVGVSLKKSVSAMYLLMLYLPLMGFIRRSLIPVAGWSSFDPLVIVAPGVIFLLGSYWLYRRFVLNDAFLADTKLLRLVQWLILLDFLEAANPRQGGVMAGLGGLMFYVAPLFWMVLTKQHATERWMKILLGSVFCFGIIGAAYGLKQTFVGFYPFEQSWINLSGYAALIVGKSSRAFSTFTSAAEYAQYLGISLVIGWAIVLRGKLLLKVIAVPSMALIAYALFLESSRGIIITSALAIGVISIVAARPGRSRWIAASITVLAIVALYSGLGHLQSSNNALIEHQVSGLTHPMNSKDSTASMHIAMMLGGVTHAFTNPLGSGLGATTLAAGKLGSAADAANSEIDLSNICISDGLIGGLLYGVIMVRVLMLAFKANRKKGIVPLMILGILCVSLGQWSNGGNYSTSALIWLCIGFLDKSTGLTQEFSQAHGIERVRQQIDARNGLRSQ